MKIDKIEPIKDHPGYVYVWSNSTGWPVKEDDVQAFTEHMDDWYSIHGSFSRIRYEEECLKRGIEPVPDDDIGGYGDTYANWGMSHYHTVPENRKYGIEGMLRRCRWIGIKEEIPDIEERRRSAMLKKQRQEELKRKRKMYPSDLMAWIEKIGGIEKIYEHCADMHENNSTQLREKGRHFEWLIGHTCMHLGMDSSKKVPGYIAGTPENNYEGVYPLCPEWGADWEETDVEHPINRIAEMLKDRRIEPYKGKVTYVGYGEDCGDDVRRNLKEWL